MGGGCGSISSQILVFKSFLHLYNYCFFCFQGKAKTDLNRYRVEQAFLRSTWQVRAEAAAQRREDRKRIEKEKIMAEADPERQRRWEEKEQKRQAKRRAPRMKQLKVKAL